MNNKIPEWMEQFWNGRCETCRFFRPTVFKEESPRGLGVWYGYCIVQENPRPDRIGCKPVLNVYYKCELYEGETKEK